MSATSADITSGDWGDGYVTDVPYIEAPTPDLCPAWLSMTCVLNGQPPLPDDPLVWAELGSGGGLSACMVAAANEGVEVWGCDFNPAHVERSRQLARAAQLDGCTFDEASFETLARDLSIGPPEVDVVVVHGVYSWISPANQRHIAEFVRQRLRPGGVAYLSYEVPTGWASAIPISEAMRLYVEADGRRSDLAFPDALASIHRLAEAGARHFPLGPHEQYQLDHLADANVRYAVHEYLGSHFGPLMFDEVADTMQRARCAFVGSLDPVDHVPEFWVGEGLREVVQHAPDTTLREMLRDLSGQRALRRDVFRRGLAATAAPQREGWWDQLTVVGLGKQLDEGAVVAVPAGEANLSMEFYGPLVAALQDAPLSVARIQELGGASRRDAVTALAVLVAGGFAVPSAARPAPSTRARRLNRVLAAEVAEGRDHWYLIAPASGAAVDSDYVEVIVLDLLRDGHAAEPDALAPLVLDSLARQGRHLVDEGKIVTDGLRSLQVARDRVSAALSRRTRLGCLGLD